MRGPGPARPPSRPWLLLRAAHLGPTLAVTTLTALLAVGFALSPIRAVVVTLAVLAGQLTIGWSNDLLDLRRDRAVGRSDKPLATGELPAASVWRALLVAGVACVVLSMLGGWRSGAAHLVAVGVAHLYNLRLKATAWSWLPYAIAFGLLPAVVSLAAVPPQTPPASVIGAAAMLGVGAHFLNTLLDLDDDLATGVRGLPQRVGARGSRWLATVLLVAASGLLLLGPGGERTTVVWLALLGVAGLAVLALVGRGKVPFYAAVGIALVNVALLAGIDA